MKYIRKIHKLITLFQVALVLLSCIVSLLGLVITHPLVHYAEYAVLAGLISIPLTSLVIGCMVLLSHNAQSGSVDQAFAQRRGCFSWKRYHRRIRQLVRKPGVLTAKPCRKKAAY